MASLVLLTTASLIDWQIRMGEIEVKPYYVHDAKASERFRMNKRKSPKQSKGDKNFDTASSSGVSSVNVNDNRDSDANLSLQSVSHDGKVRRKAMKGRNADVKQHASKKQPMIAI